MTISPIRRSASAVVATTKPPARSFGCSIQLRFDGAVSASLTDRAGYSRQSSPCRRSEGSAPRTASTEAKTGAHARKANSTIASRSVASKSRIWTPLAQHGTRGLCLPRSGGLTIAAVGDQAAERALPLGRWSGVGASTCRVAPAPQAADVLTPGDAAAGARGSQPSTGMATGIASQLRSLVRKRTPD